MTDSIKVQIGADDTGLQASLDRAQASIQGSVNRMQASMNSLTSAFSKIQAGFIGLTAILAGGKIFGDVIQAGEDWTKGSVKLAKSLGITTESASVYQVALRHLGIDNDVLVSATEKLSKQVYGNSDAFVRLGVQTKTSGGAFRAIGDILRDTIDRLAQIHNVVERNVAGQQAFGKGWSEVKPLVRLTSEEIAQATVRAKELGLVVGDEGAADTKKYGEAMRDLKLVGTSISVTLGKELLPALTQIARAFSGEGSTAAHVFSEGIKVVAYSIGIAGIEMTKWKVWFDAVQQSFKAFGSGWSAADTAIKAKFDKDIDALNAKADHLWEKLHQPIPAPKMAAPQDDDGPGPFSSGKHDTSRMSAFEAELAELRANQAEKQNLTGGFQKMSMEAERNFWQKIHDTQVLSSADQKSVRIKLADAITAVRQKQFDGEMAQLREQEEAVKGSFDAQIALAQERAARIALAYGAESREAAEAAKQVIAVELAKAASIEQIRQTALRAEESRALAEIDVRERLAQFEVDLGASTDQQLLDQERQFEDARFEIRRQTLLKELELAGNAHNGERAAEVNAQIEELEHSHQGRLQQIRMQGALLQRRGWQDLFGSIQSGFQRTLMDFMKGNLTIAGLFRGLFASVADSLAQMVAKNIANLVMQAAIGKTTALKELQASAAASAGKAYEAMVGIPYVGPFIAPVVAAGAYAGVMAFGASAKGGYDIPAHVNPVTQLHAQEMVLPAKHADVIRRMADDDGGGGVRALNLQFNIKANDGASVKKMLLDNHRTIAAAMKKNLRETGHLHPSINAVRGA